MYLSNIIFRSLRAKGKQLVAALQGFEVLGLQRLITVLEQLGGGGRCDMKSIDNN